MGTQWRAWFYSNRNYANFSLLYKACKIEECAFIPHATSHTETPTLPSSSADIVNDLDGSFSAEHGIGKLKREELKFYNPEIEINLMKSIKTTFDPKNILNPGKVL